MKFFTPLLSPQQKQRLTRNNKAKNVTSLKIINLTFKGGVDEIEVLLAPRVHPPLDVLPYQLLLLQNLHLLPLLLPLQPPVPGASQLVAVLNGQPPAPVPLQHHHLLKAWVVCKVFRTIYLLF